MKTLSSLLLTILFAFSAYSSPNPGGGSPEVPPAELNGNLESIVDSLVTRNIQMGEQQVADILATYFDLKKGKGGAEVYVPKMVTIEFDRVLITQSAGITQEEVVTQQMDVPLITLASISLLQINNAETLEDGSLKVNIGQMPVPRGLNTLIETLSNMIVPVQVDSK